MKGTATRDERSCWQETESTYDPSRVYVLEGDGDPCLLRDNFFSCGKPQFVYEVEPMGERRPDGPRGTWTPLSYDKAKVLMCVCRPGDHSVAPVV